MTPGEIRGIGRQHTVRFEGAEISVTVNIQLKRLV